MSLTPSPSGDGSSPQLAVLKELKEMCLHLMEIKEGVNVLRRSNKEGMQGIANEVLFMKTSVTTELADVKKVIEGFSSAVTKHPSFAGTVSNSSVTADNEEAKSLAFACLAYCRLIVGLALLGKGDVFDCYARPNVPDELEDNCAKFVLGDSVGLDDVEALLDLYITVDRSSITGVYRRNQVSTVQIKKMKTLRDRICLQRRRVHDMVVPKVVNGWMNEAPGFTFYRFGVAASQQPNEIVNAAKEALRKADGAETANFMNGAVYGRCFQEACRELMRASSYVVAHALMDLVRVVPRELTDQVKRNIRMVDTEQGYPEREMHAFDERDGFLPEQLAFVVVKVKSKLTDIVMAGQQRAKRGLELGHYRHWLRQTLHISKLVTHKSSRETLEKDDWTYVKPCDPTDVYGVTIRGNLPESDINIIDYILTGETSVDLGSEVRRRRLTSMEGSENENQGLSADDTHDPSGNIADGPSDRYSDRDSVTV